MKYKVGDKVRVKKGLEVDKLYGVWRFTSIMERLEGTIMKVAMVYPIHQAYKLEGVVGYLFTDEMLEPVTPAVSVPKPTWRIIIEGDENTSRAKYIMGKKIVREVSAKRYHKDKHDPAMAARALIGKMFPEENEPKEPKYFTGRVVCVECPEGIRLTVGKIYEVNDGRMACDQKFVEIEKITSVEDLISRCKDGIKFIEIKE